MLDESSVLVESVSAETGRRQTLPVPLTPLIGREQEMHEARSLLLRPEVRLLTLTGTGGIGKTRLALELSQEVTTEFSDGVCFISLATVKDARFVPFTIAEALGMSDSGDQPFFERLKAFLANKQTLLLLDNVEQVISSAPQLVELLAACPCVKALVTSRAPLHVRGEYEYPVPPLVLPDPTHLPHTEALVHYGAVALFVQRAAAMKPTFRLDEANAPTIAHICIQLEGIPLAIELAAAYIKVLSPQALLKRLSHRLQLLIGGAQDLPERQQTLRNTIKWSYELLSPDEQRLFRHLALFVGGSTLEAIEAICPQINLGISALQGVTSLIDKSLLRQVEPVSTVHSAENETRLVMLETLREYGLECLEEMNELGRARQLHAQYFLSLAEEAEPQMSGSEQEIWLERLEREHDNLRAALRWLVENQEREMALRLCSALYWFWSVRGHLAEGRHWFDQSLANSEQVSPSVRAKALNYAGALAYNEDEHEQGEQFCSEALSLYRALGDKHGCAVSLYWLGQSACWTQHDYACATQQAEESLQLFQETGDQSGVADVLLLLAYIRLNQGDYSQTRSLLEQGLALFRAGGDLWGVAYTLHYLGRTLFSQGDYVAAQSTLEESLAVSERLGYRGGYANSLGILGMIALKSANSSRARVLMEESLAVQREAGGNIGIATALIRLAKLYCSQNDTTKARTLYEESLALLEKLDDKDTLASVLEGLGVVCVAQGQTMWAIHLWGAAATLRKAIGTPISPADNEEYVRAVEAAREVMGEETFNALYQEGLAMTPAQALAGQGREPISSPHDESKTLSTTSIYDDAVSELPRASSPLHTELTVREKEVLRLVAMGYTNPQIAKRLGISPLTVNAHLRSIYNKLEVSSRSAATRYAIEQKLI